MIRFYWDLFLFEFAISAIGCLYDFAAVHFLIFLEGKILIISLNLVKKKSEYKIIEKYLHLHIIIMKKLNGVK